MAIKVYLSPSSQNNNACSGGDTEAKHCRKIAQQAEKDLKRNGYSVKVATKGLDVAGRIKESNEWGADVHIPIHTNAGGGDGTLVMCYTGCTGNKYVKNIYSALAEVSPGKDDGIKVRTDLAEITGTTAMCVYTECEFHDTHGDWIDKNTGKLGKAIAKGMCKADGKTFKSEGGNTSTDSGTLYKIQAGAFAEKENAEKLVKQLKAEGFDAFAYQSGKLYKVQAGAFSSKSNADALAEKLENTGFDAYVYRG